MRAERAEMLSGEVGRLFHSLPEAGPRGRTGISIESEILGDFLERTESQRLGNLLSHEHTLRHLRIQGCCTVTQSVLKWVSIVAISQIQMSVSFLNPGEGKGIVLL